MVGWTAVKKSTTGINPLYVSLSFQDVLSMLDQPSTFNSDDFDIPMYPSFNE